MGALLEENFFYIISLTSTRIAASSVAEIVVAPMVDCVISPDFSVSAIASIFLTPPTNEIDGISPARPDLNPPHFGSFFYIFTDSCISGGSDLDKGIAVKCSEIDLSTCQIFCSTPSVLTLLAIKLSNGMVTALA